MPIRYIKRWYNKTINQIIDVRSPSEFHEDHIPGSINLPVLYDEERKLIGSIYKNDSSFKAKKLGASLISKNIAMHIKKKFINNPGSWKPLIYCWRGGQRSNAIAIILSEIGWEVFLLKGGYKTYRKEVNNSLNSIINNYKYIVLRGKTGTAKTKILEMIINKGGYALNLENLAKHKGSLLGKLSKSSQPSQKYFESLIYFELKKLRKNKPVLVESESSKIGNLYLPSNLLYKIENSPCIDIESNIDARASYLVKDYSKFILKKNSFNELFLYASSKLGKEVVNKWKKNYENKNWKELALQLIVEYYDPLYSHKKNQKKNLSIESHNFKTLNHDSIEKFCSYLIKKLY